jgi:hypothetical protein
MTGAPKRTSHVRPVEVFSEIHQRQKSAEDPRFQIIREVQPAGCHARQPFPIFRDEAHDFALAILGSIAERRLPAHLRAAGLQREREVQDAKPLVRDGLRRFVLATRNLARRSHGTRGNARDDRLHRLREKTSTPRASTANLT